MHSATGRSRGFGNPRFLDTGYQRQNLPRQNYGPASECRVCLVHRKRRGPQMPLVSPPSVKVYRHRLCCCIVGWADLWLLESERGKVAPPLLAECQRGSAWWFLLLPWSGRPILWTPSPLVGSSHGPVSHERELARCSKTDRNSLLLCM